MNHKIETVTEKESGPTLGKVVKLSSTDKKKILKFLNGLQRAKEFVDQVESIPDLKGLQEKIKDE